MALHSVVAPNKNRKKIVDFAMAPIGHHTTGALQFTVVSALWSAQLKKYKNQHCLWTNADLTNREIMAISGHRNESGIQRYMYHN